MSADDIWNDLFGGFGNLSRRVNDLFDGFDGPGTRSYGISVYQGPDGVRHVREFGDPVGTIPISGRRDPFIDVSEEEDLVRVVVEIPGVNKSDISLSCTHNVLSISTEVPGRAFSKEIALPYDVDTGSARAEYNNGLLEVTLDKVAPPGEGVRIHID